MTKASQDNERALFSILTATAMQLDIAAEDAETAVDDVVSTFEAAADSIEELEFALNSSDLVDRLALLDVVIKMRKMLRKSVVSLQFQDRLTQRMALASRELRSLAEERSVSALPVLGDDLKVPKSVASLYTGQQMHRIRAAAAGHDEAFQTIDAGNVVEHDDIELF